MCRLLTIGFSVLLVVGFAAVDAQAKGAAKRPGRNSSDKPLGKSDSDIRELARKAFERADDDNNQSLKPEEFRKADSAIMDSADAAARAAVGEQNVAVKDLLRGAQKQPKPDRDSDGNVTESALEEYALDVFESAGAAVRVLAKERAERARKEAQERAAAAKAREQAVERAKAQAAAQKARNQQARMNQNKKKRR